MFLDILVLPSSLPVPLGPQAHMPEVPRQVPKSLGTKLAITPVLLDSRPPTTSLALTVQNMVRCMCPLLNGPRPAPNTTNVRPKLLIALTLVLVVPRALNVPVGMPLTTLSPLPRTVAMWVALLIPMPYITREIRVGNLLPQHLPPLNPIRRLATLMHPYGLELTGTPPRLVLSRSVGMTRISDTCLPNRANVHPSPKLTPPLFRVATELTNESTGVQMLLGVTMCLNEAPMLPVAMVPLLENPVLLWTATMHLALETPLGLLVVKLEINEQLDTRSAHSVLAIR